MANLIKKGSGEQQEKAIKVELPDGTGGEIPIQPDAPTIDLMDASSMPSNTYKDGGKIKKNFKPHMMYDNGKAVKANTKAEHLSLSKKGYTHSKKQSTAHSAIDKLIKQSK
tara:strand:- start:7623 stop:7955 length:333 start_codon:yes stop_codon:yes gene_type:complete